MKIRHALFAIPFLAVTPAQADPLEDLGLDYGDCVIEAAVVMSLSGESAGDVADAAMVACREYEGIVNSHLIGKGFDATDRAAFWSHVNPITRRTAVAAVVRFRTHIALDQ